MAIFRCFSQGVVVVFIIALVVLPTQCLSRSTNRRRFEALTASYSTSNGGGGGGSAPKAGGGAGGGSPNAGVGGGSPGKPTGGGSAPGVGGGSPDKSYGSGPSHGAGGGSPGKPNGGGSTPGVGGGSPGKPNRGGSTPGVGGGSPGKPNGGAGSPNGGSTPGVGGGSPAKAGSGVGGGSPGKPNLGHLSPSQQAKCNEFGVKAASLEQQCRQLKGQGKDNTPEFKAKTQEIQKLKSDIKSIAGSNFDVDSFVSNVNGGGGDNGKAGTPSSPSNGGSPSTSGSPNFPKTAGSPSTSPSSGSSPSTSGSPNKSLKVSGLPSTSGSPNAPKTSGSPSTSPSNGTSPSTSGSPNKSPNASGSPNSVSGLPSNSRTQKSPSSGSPSPSSESENTFSSLPGGPSSSPGYKSMSASEFSSLDFKKQSEAKELGKKLVSKQKELSKIDKNDKDFASKSESVQNEIDNDQKQLQTIIGANVDITDFVSTFVDSSFSSLVSNALSSGNPLQKLSPSQFSSLDAGKQSEAKELGQKIVSKQSEFNKLDKTDQDFVKRSESLQNEISDAKKQLQVVIGVNVDVKHFITNFVDNSFSAMVPNDESNASNTSSYGTQSNGTPRDPANPDAPSFSDRNVRRDLVPSSDAVKAKIAEFAKMNEQEDEVAARLLLDAAKCSEDEKNSAIMIRANFKAFAWSALQFELKSDFTSADYQHARDAAFLAMDSFKNLMRNLVAGAVDLDAISDAALDAKMFMLSSLSSMLSVIQ